MAGTSDSRDSISGIRMADPAAFLSHIQVPHTVRAYEGKGPLEKRRNLTQEGDAERA